MNEQVFELFPLQSIGKAKLVQHRIAAFTSTARVRHETPLSFALCCSDVPTWDRLQSLA